MSARLIASLALLVSLASPVAAQERSLQQLLVSGPPPSMKLKELSSGQWHRMRLQVPTEKKQEEGGGFLGLLGGLMGGMFGGGMANMLTPPPAPIYTRGETVNLGGETFLIAYRAVQKSLDVTALMKAGEGGELPPPEVLKPDSEVTLSYIKLRSVDALNDIRPFNLEYEIAESEKAAQIEAALRKEMGKGKGGLGGFGGAPAPAGPAEGDVGTMPSLQPSPAPAPKKPAAKKPAPPRRK